MDIKFQRGHVIKMKWWKYLKCTKNCILFSRFSEVMCENTSKCTNVWYKFSQNISRGDVWKYLKMRQNGYQFFAKNVSRVTCENTQNGQKWKSVFSKSFQVWYVKIPKNVPKWVSILHKFSGVTSEKYIKMHQNGYQFANTFQVMCEKTSKYAKIDTNLFQQ